MSCLQQRNHHNGPINLQNKNYEFKQEFGREGLEQTPDGDWILKVSPELQYRWEFDQGPVLMEDIDPDVETEEDISEDEANLRKSMEKAVEYRQGNTDDINEEYTTVISLRRDEVTDALAHTPKSGGLSLPDIRKLAKTISSQEEGSFDFDPNDSRENYIEKILAWVDSKGDTITDVLEESEYMFDDLCIDKTNKLFKSLGIKYKPNKSMTLSNIYNYE